MEQSAWLAIGLYACGYVGLLCGLGYRAGLEGVADDSRLMLRVASICLLWPILLLWAIPAMIGDHKRPPDPAP